MVAGASKNATGHLLLFAFESLATQLKITSMVERWHHGGHATRQDFVLLVGMVCWYFGCSCKIRCETERLPAGQAHRSGQQLALGNSGNNLKSIQHGNTLEDHRQACLASWRICKRGCLQGMLSQGCLQAAKNHLRLTEQPRMAVLSRLSI